MANDSRGTEITQPLHPDEVQAQLDSYAEDHGAGSVQDWYVDPETSHVVVTASTSRSDAATKGFLLFAERFGAAVRIDATAAAAATAVRSLYGGREIATSTGRICTSGFNAKTSSGKAVLITAGHCARGWPVFYRLGIRIGTTRAFSFPGNDYAVINVNTNAWRPRAAVAKSGDDYVSVTGHSKAAVGTRVCKRGRTTGWTCGRIIAYNQTVNYSGKIVRGLVRFAACVRPGDSGGSVMAGTKAQGMVSGTVLYRKGSAQVCGSAVGTANIAWYQPVGEVLTRYNLRLLTR